MQNLAVAVIVAACTAYAVWVLLPAALRRAAALQALKLPWPAPVASRLQKAARLPSGCGCDGCDSPNKPAANTAQPIRIHRQPRP